MQTFELKQPRSVAEAVRLAAADGEARLLAGGQTLLPALRLGLAVPGAFIDLSGLEELRGIRADGKQLVVGAMCRHAEVASSAEVRKRLPALARLAGAIGDRQVRNLGTLGGSIANSDPAADYPAAVLGLGATVQTNSRTIAADSFFTGLFATALRSGELITAVSFPWADQAGYCKFPQPASHFALVGVFVARFGKQVRVAVTGAGAHAMRMPALEQALAQRFVPEACDGVQVGSEGLNADLHGSAAYRAQLIPRLARVAVQQALG
ncbi:MAG TPA: xanthine dehydrogenase family protein subunit M [Steroidobacteraceae bacterium]|nr:xanthine dehydrogenase family protein subunit M [Steroidobacteraceae bacterium]